MATKNTPAEKPEVKAAEPAESNELLAAMLAAKKKAVVEKRPLSPAQRAKIQMGRLRHAANGGGAKAMSRAVALNAAELGMSVDAYRAQFAEAIEG